MITKTSSSLITTILTLFLILCFGCGESVEDKPDITTDNQPTGIIKGEIQPAGIEAKLELLKNGQLLQSTTTDLESQFSFSKLEFGSYQIKVISNGYQTEETTILVELQLAELSLELQLKPVPAKLSGVVINSEGKFISDAIITIGDQRQTTDQLGVFRFNQLKADTKLEMTVTAKSMLTKTVQVGPIVKGGSSKIQVELEPEVIEEENGAEVGDIAPIFSLLDTSSQKVSLTDYAGEKNILLTFSRGKI